MTSRERLQAALNHTQPDRVPVDLGATFVTGIHVSALARLRRMRQPDDEAPAELGKVVVFTSSKPGSGSSTMATHLSTEKGLTR